MRNWKPTARSIRETRLAYTAGLQISLNVAHWCGTLGGKRASARHQLLAARALLIPPQPKALRVMLRHALLHLHRQLSMHVARHHVAVVMVVLPMQRLSLGWVLQQAEQGGPK